MFSLIDKYVFITCEKIIKICKKKKNEKQKTKNRRTKTTENQISLSFKKGITSSEKSD